jgi:hypothetical protein
MSNLSEFNKTTSSFGDEPPGVKTDPNFEGPIDTFLYKICENVSEFFYNTGHTPNMITTYSFILGLTSAYFYYHDNIFLFVICFIGSYFFDCLDGYIARKYNMKSDFGEIFDSISDGTVIILLLYIVYIKHHHKLNPSLLTVFAIFVVLLNLELSCQEKIINNENPTDFKGTLRSFCPETIVDQNAKVVSYNGFTPFSYLRWFSPATFNLMFMLILMGLSQGGAKLAPHRR